MPRAPDIVTTISTVEAKQVLSLRLTGNAPPLSEVRTRLALLDEQRFQTTIPASQWIARFPDLIRFCVYVERTDVPNDMLEGTITVSKMILYYLEQVELTNDENGQSLYHLGEKVRMKLIYYLSKNIMNRSTEALHQVEDQLLEHKEHMRRQKSVHQNVPWIDNIELYSLYGDMLVLNQKFDIRLRVLLENVIESAGHPFNTTTPNVVAYACIAHMHLGLLLQLMGEQSDKQKWHVQYAAEYFRRSPAGIEDTVDMFLRRKTSPRHPVYIALGEQWMKDHPLIRNSKKSGKSCRHCSKTYLTATLFRCSGCHVIYYCSRECQKANWKSHKKACKEDAEARKNLSDHKASEDVTNWQQSSHYANKDAMIHALNLQRDPSRGRTHMIFRSLNYVSEGEELKDRVRVVRCSIYKVEDILDDLLLFHTGHITSRDDFREAMKQTIASTLGEPDNSDEDSGVGDQPAQIPIIHLTTGAGIRGAAVNVVPMSADYVRSLKYDPHWRKHVNGEQGVVPDAYLLPTNPQDAEHAF